MDIETQNELEKLKQASPEFAAFMALPKEEQLQRGLAGLNGVLAELGSEPWDHWPTDSELEERARRDTVVFRATKRPLRQRIRVAWAILLGDSSRFN